MSRVPVRLAAGPADAPPGWATLNQSACPCCVGRVQLQVDLVRLIRESRPPGVVIELPEPGHRRALRRALGEWPFTEHVVVLPD